MEQGGREMVNRSIIDVNTSPVKARIFWSIDVSHNRERRAFTRLTFIEGYKYQGIFFSSRKEERKKDVCAKDVNREKRTVIICVFLYEYSGH